LNEISKLSIELAEMKNKFESLTNTKNDLENENKKLLEDLN